MEVKKNDFKSLEELNTFLKENEIGIISIETVKEYIQNVVLSYMRDKVSPLSGTISIIRLWYVNKY